MMRGRARRAPTMTRRAARSTGEVDYIKMACTAAGISLREALAPQELVKALLSGNPTPGKHAYFIVLLEEAPAELLRGLVAQVSASTRPGKVAKNVRRIASKLGVRLKAAD